MDEAQIKTLVQAGMPDAKVEIGGDGYHIEVQVVSEQFAGLARVRRQQLVYAALGEAIRSGALHAVNIHALTAAEWAARQSDQAS